MAYVTEKECAELMSEMIQRQRDKASEITIAREAMRTLKKCGFERVRVWLIHHESASFYGAACSYLPHNEFAAIKGPLKDRSFAVYHPKTRSAILDKKNIRLKEYLGDYIDTTIEAPMYVGARLIGSIGLDNNGKELHPVRGKEIAMPIVQQTALAMHSAITEKELAQANALLKAKVEKATAALRERNEELKWIANHDALTGLPNRRWFLAELKKTVAALPATKKIVVGVIDLDYFKMINDSKGHAAGDKILKKIAHLLDEQVPGIVARYAGDEFIFAVITKNEKNVKQCLAAAQKKSAAIGQNISIGCMCYPTDTKSSSVRRIIHIADEALYEAKHTGRGRTVWYADMPHKESMAKAQKKIDSISARGIPLIDYAQQLELVEQVTRQLQTANTFQEVVVALMALLKKEMCFSKMRLYIRDDTAGVLKCVHAVGIAKKYWQEIMRSIHDKQSVCGRVVQTGSIIDIPDVSKCTFVHPSTVAILKAKAILAVPIRMQGRIHGVIAANYNPLVTRYTTKNKQLLEMIATHVGLAMKQIESKEEIEEAKNNLEKRVVKASQKLLGYSRTLEHKIMENEKLRRLEKDSHYETIKALVQAVEQKDAYTRGHSGRVAKYSSRLAKAAGLTGDALMSVTYSGLLHDIGKIALDASLLNKVDAPTKEEKRLLQQHPTIGANILKGIGFLKKEISSIKHHHEWWDGSGYPSGLKGENIPLAARIVNIADSYDAMISRRSYGGVLSRSKAILEFKKGAGIQFDPKLAKIFIALIKEKKV